MSKLLACATLFLVCSLSLAQAWGEEPSVDTKTFRAVTDKDGVQRVDMIGGSYYFDPDHIVLTVHVPVELKIRKQSGLVPHDIVMKSPEAGMDFRVSLDTEPKVIRFVPSRIGRYPFYCDKKLLFFESHREKGMKGVIEVVP